ncbi:co-chaperone YbbN [Rhizobacter sp. Root1221]|uniref:thioredoxin family protein n=1 Tax=Rhizobacter sp. Root1221 TaxID=1736433 RepID=UPI0006F2B516|nr:thioredoxin family protein [Rhizobacter sp. Root1221]KQW03100.1 thioredoxin [Rhizobacter sp. Root1221]
MHTTDRSEPLLVACLCAAWCGSCREYRATFDSVAAAFPDARFVWIDIEDESDLVDPLEVENFPTVLIASRGDPLFFGPLTPHRETLVRLVRTQADGAGGPGLADEDVRAVVARIVRKP